MRILGIDYGTKRLGLAVTDPDETLALPYATLEKTTRDKLFSELFTIIEREGVEKIVLGLPLTLDGGESLTTRQVRNFAKDLERKFKGPVILVDERLSSHAAKADLDAAGVKKKRQKAVLDQQAAVRILETHLTQKQ
ncbi:MAG: Holliday junction resolvase RuvX [Thermodesulfobacteriota bacterium]|nr:Holliday junction resolvase RuvX [Thermodesulfobacteriota bacterium]